jgi:Domain of unknown function (DUF4136)
MKQFGWRRVVLVLFTVIIGWQGVPLSAAKTDVSVEFDKKFSFAGIKTWAWHPEGAGDVRLAVSSRDDAAKVAGRVDPVIVPAVERELAQRGLTSAASGADVYVHYYALATVGQSAQVHGQFLPAAPEWGIPPFVASTSALSIYPVGTLIIDITSASTNAILWRGIAKKEIEFDRPDADRRKVLEKAIHDLLGKFPPKK